MKVVTTAVREEPRPCWGDEGDRGGQRQSLLFKGRCDLLCGAQLPDILSQGKELHDGLCGLEVRIPIFEDPVPESTG